MITFADGPAKGAALELRRAPLFLRVVQSADGIDALDQLDDVARPEERIFVYVRTGQASRVHVCRSPRRLSGWFFSAEYRLHQTQPDDAILRDFDRWSSWVLETAAELEFFRARERSPGRTFALVFRKGSIKQVRGEDVARSAGELLSWCTVGDRCWRRVAVVRKIPLGGLRK